MVVHYAGFPCNMDRIMEIARNHNLFVMEDAAHAAGAEYRSKLKGEGLRLKVQGSELNDGQRTTNNGQLTTGNGQRATGDRHAHKVGTIGDIGCFSFFGFLRG